MTRSHIIVYLEDGNYFSTWINLPPKEASANYFGYIWYSNGNVDTGEENFSRCNKTVVDRVEVNGIRYTPAEYLDKIEAN